VRLETKLQPPRMGWKKLSQQSPWRWRTRKGKKRLKPLQERKGYEGISQLDSSLEPRTAEATRSASRKAGSVNHPRNRIVLHSQIVIPGPGFEIPMSATITHASRFSKQFRVGSGGFFRMEEQNGPVGRIVRPYTGGRMVSLAYRPVEANEGFAIKSEFRRGSFESTTSILQLSRPYTTRAFWFAI